MGTFVSSLLDKKGCNMTAFYTSLLQSISGCLIFGWAWSIVHGYVLYTGSKGNSSDDDDEESSDQSSRSGKKVLIDGNLAKTVSSVGTAETHQKTKTKSKKQIKKELKEKEKKQGEEKKKVAANKESVKGIDSFDQNEGMFS